MYAILLTRMRKRAQGFTLIELILAIAVLGILAVSAFAIFINITTNARQASRDGTVGALRAGINIFRTSDLINNGPPGIYPATLDNVAANTACSITDLCFGTVLHQGIPDVNWLKTDNTTYVYNDGTSTFTYTYTPATGAFTSPTAP